MLHLYGDSLVSSIVPSVGQQCERQCQWCLVIIPKTLMQFGDPDLESRRLLSQEGGTFSKLSLSHTGYSAPEECVGPVCQW